MLNTDNEGWHEAVARQALVMMRDTTRKRYQYEPSLVAALIFVILFAAATIVHVYQMVRTRTWFLIAFCCGGFLEVIGYAARLIGSTEKNDANYARGPFIIQTVFLLVAPALFAASIYMELGRIVELVHGDHYLFINRRWLTKIFVFGDVISFLMQAAGGSILGTATTTSRQNIGTNLVIIGLFVQIVFFGCFVLAALLFHWRLHRQPTHKVLVDRVPYNRHLVTLYGVGSLIFIRSIVRVVEFLQGFDGYITRHEAFIYIFDALPMFVAVVILSWVHPSEVKALLRGGNMMKGLRLAEPSGHAV